MARRSGRADDPRLGPLLAQYGLPADPMPLIRAEDIGEGDVVLSASVGSVRFRFHRENETSWFLHEIGFAARDGQRPDVTNLPLGASLEEARAECRARFGEPTRTTRIGIDVWRFGRMAMSISYGKNDRPRAVRYMQFFV